MLKFFTMSLGLAAALSFCGVSKAGLFHNDGCSTCGLASPQGPVVSPQAPCPSPQVECVQPCEKKCNLFSGLCNKMNCGLSNCKTGFNSLCCKLKPKPKC